MAEKQLGTATSAPTDTATKIYVDTAISAITASAALAAGNLTATSVKTANYTASASEIVSGNASGGAFAVTLPPNPADNTRIVVKKIDSSLNAVTVQCAGQDKFDSATGPSSRILSLPNETISLHYEPGVWYVIGAAGAGETNQYAATIGNGSATSIAVTHGLGTVDVIVSVHVIATGKEVDCDVTKTSGNVVTLTFATAPALNALRCTVIGTAFGAGASTPTTSLGISDATATGRSLITAADAAAARTALSTVRATTRYYDAKLSGVVADGVTDDTAAWANAIDVVSAAGGGKIWWEGSSVVSQIQLKSNVGLQGLGRNKSRIVHKVGRATDQHCILLEENSAVHVSLEDFTLFGSRTAQTAGFACGIFMRRTVKNSALPAHLIRNVRIEAVKGTGIRLGYDLRSSVVDNVSVYFCDEYGIRLDTWSDNTMSNIDIAQSGSHGLYIRDTGQCKFSNIKVWLSGRIDNTGSGIFHEGGGWNQFSNVGTQENYGNGMSVLGTVSAPVKHVLCEGLSSDSDNLSDGENYGLRLNYVENSIFALTVSSVLGTDLNLYPGAAQPYAAAGVFNSSKNKIVSSSLPVNQGGGVTWPIMGNSLKDNEIDLCRSRLDETPAGTSFTPNPYLFSEMRYTLTGNRTISAPVSATGTNAPVGVRFTLILIQDATGGRTVTWNSAYKLPTGFAVDTAPNARTVVELECQGADDWLAISTNQDVPGLSTARRVAVTANGSGTNANSWAKIATINTGTTIAAEINLTLMVVNSRDGASTDAAIVVVKHRASTVANGDSIIQVGMLAHYGDSTGGLSSIGPDSFQVVNSGWNTNTELWMQKKLPWGRFSVYELGRSASDFTGNPVAFSDNAVWQSTAPTGTLTKTSQGVTVSGVNVISKPVDRQTGSAFYEAPATYTAAAGQIVPVDATFNDFTVKLPSAPPNGSTVTVQRVDAEPLRKVTVVRQGSDTINLAGGQTSYVMPVPSQTAVFQYYGGVWRIVSDSAQPSKLIQVYGSPAEKLISRMAVRPSDIRQEVIEGLISDLLRCGVWGKLDALYVFAAHSVQAARLNWKSSVVTDASSVNSPVFTVDRGFTGDGGAAWIDTNTTPSEYVQYKASDATLGVYVRTATTLNANDISASPYAHITTAANSSETVIRVNSSNFFSALHGGDRSGLFAASRFPAENRGFAYKDGIAMTPSGSDAQSAGILPAAPMQFLRGGDVFSTRQLAAGFWGAGLTAQEHADLNTALTIYMTAIGAAV